MVSNINVYQIIINLKILKKIKIVGYVMDGHRKKYKFQEINKMI